MKRSSYCIVALALSWAATARAESAGNILESSGVKGGLVVVIGCSDPALLVGLKANDSYPVHGLDTKANNVVETREHIRSRGLYGPVSVDQFDGRRLPYVDNMVNLLVAEELGDVKREEVMRVLAPLSAAMIGGNKTVKPWPKEIDEWTHFLHGADNNAVAKDTVVGPPKRYPWIAGPRWARSHDHLSSLSAMVSAKGCVFYIVDEAAGVRGGLIVHAGCGDGTLGDGVVVTTPCRRLSQNAVTRTPGRQYVPARDLLPPCRYHAKLNGSNNLIRARETC